MSTFRPLRRLLSIGALAAPVALAAGQLHHSPIDELGWMAGCWEGAGSGGTRVEEHWMAPRAGTMFGLSRTTRGDSTIAHESMSIYERSGLLVFVAQPSGQAPAEFTQAGGSEREVVFSNPEHDFPQTIRYRLAGADSLTARIEGANSGQQLALDFPMLRVACPGSESN